MKVIVETCMGGGYIVELIITYAWQQGEFTWQLKISLRVQEGWLHSWVRIVMSLVSGLGWYLIQMDSRANYWEQLPMAPCTSRVKGYIHIVYG